MAIELLKNPDARNDPPRPLLEHLLALRDMIVFAAVSWVVCAVVAGVFSPTILAWLKSPAAASEDMLQGLDLTSGFSTIMSIALWGGTALSFLHVPVLSGLAGEDKYPAILNVLTEVQQCGTFMEKYVEKRNAHLCITESV